MEAVAHDPGFAKKAGISQSVGKDFAAADEGKKFDARPRHFDGTFAKGPCTHSPVHHYDGCPKSR